MKKTLSFVFLAAMVCGLQAADRAEITFADARIFPESLSSTKDGRKNTSTRLLKTCKQRVRS